MLDVRAVADIVVPFKQKMQQVVWNNLYFKI